jgi:hypothetical protein
LSETSIAIILRERPQLRVANRAIPDTTGTSAFNTHSGPNEHAGIAAEAGFEHDSLTPDCEITKGLEAWRPFVEVLAKVYLGSWMKTEHVDVEREPFLYILRVKKPAVAHTGILFAAKMLALQLFQPKAICIF